MSDYWKDVEASAAAPGAVTAAEFLVPTNARLALRAKTAATWMWVFAGLSVVNLVLAYVGAPLRMVVSVWCTELLYAVGGQVGPLWAVIALVISGGMLASVAALGWAMLRFHRWSFIAGAVLLAIDALAIYQWTTLAGLWPFLLHGVAIYYLWVGFKAAQLHHDRKTKGLV